VFVERGDDWDAAVAGDGVQVQRELQELLQAPLVQQGQVVRRDGKDVTLGARQLHVAVGMDGWMDGWCGGWVGGDPPEDR